MPLNMFLWAPISMILLLAFGISVIAPSMRVGWQMYQNAIDARRRNIPFVTVYNKQKSKESIAITIKGAAIFLSGQLANLYILSHLSQATFGERTDSLFATQIIGLVATVSAVSYLWMAHLDGTLDLVSPDFLQRHQQSEPRVALLFCGELSRPAIWLTFPGKNATLTHNSDLP